MKIEDAVMFGCIILSGAISSIGRRSVPPVASKKQIQAHQEVCQGFDDLENDIKSGKDPKIAIEFLEGLSDLMVRDSASWPVDILENIRFRAKRLRNLIEHAGMDIRPA